MKTSGGYFDSKRLSKIDESDRKEILNLVEFKERMKSLLLENKVGTNGSERFSLVKSGLLIHDNTVSK